MKDHFFFMCTTPHGEACAQLGSERYHENARIEAEIFIDQLQRTYGLEPDGSYYKIAECNHDFGVYLDVKFCFDDAVESHVEHMMRIQESVEHWDESAKKLLSMEGYHLELTN